MIVRYLIAPLTVALVCLHAGQAGAQGGFPAPLPGQAATPSASPFPPVNGAPAAATPAPSAFPSSGAAPVGGGGFGGGPPPPQASGPADACMVPILREEAEKWGRLIKAASERHAPPDEACKLISKFGQAETNMIKYVEKN